MSTLLIAADEPSVLALDENPFFTRRAGLDRRLTDRKVTLGVVFTPEEAAPALARVSLQKLSTALGTGD